MRKTDIRYQTYLKILEEELLPAMGCTEPIAVAYAAAMARDLLGSMPVRMEVNVSGNILKNVKSVVVPNTGGLRGIQAAAAAGAAVGQAERELEVIAQVTSEQVGEIRTFLERCPIQVGLAATSQIFYIEVLAFGGDGSSSEAAISGFHTNVIRKRKNGQTLLQREEAAERESPCDEKSLLSIEGALEFADTGLGPASDRLQLCHRPGGTPGKLWGEHRLSAAEARRGRCEGPGQGLCRGGLRRQDERL